MNFVELDDVPAIACEVLGLEVNALLHVADVGLADSAVARPQAGFADQEFHPTLEAKAASLLLGLARNHAFIDGNKRTAVLASAGRRWFCTARLPFAQGSWAPPRAGSG